MRNKFDNPITSYLLIFKIVLSSFVGQTQRFHAASVTSKKLPNVFKVAQNDFTRKLKYFDTFTNIANVGDLGKIIVAKGFEKLPNLVKLVATYLPIWSTLFKVAISVFKHAAAHLSLSTNFYCQFFFRGKENLYSMAGNLKCVCSKVNKSLSRVV